MLETLKGVRRRVGETFLFDRIVERFRAKGPMVDTTAIFNYGARGNFSIIAPIQSRQELVPLLKLVQSIRPKVMMEIGTASGGTLFMGTRVAAADATIISLDLPGGVFGGGYDEKRIPLYEAFALPGQDLHLIRDDSHAQRSLDRVTAILAGRSIDYLFIDGDHTYEGVRRDYEMYAPLVRSGGLIAFHDIISAPDVGRFWKEVRPRHQRGEEFIGSKGAVFGIGVVWQD